MKGRAIAGCLFSVALLVGLTAGYYFWLVRAFDPPATWIVPPLAALLTTACIGAMVQSRQGARDLRCLNRARQGKIPQSGQYVALLGRIESLRQPMTAPFSLRPSVIYEYEVHLKATRPGQQDGTVETNLFFGCGMVPCAIESEGRSHRLLSFPDLSQLAKDTYRKSRDLSAARQYVLKTPSARIDDLTLVERASEVHSLIAGAQEATRDDWRSVSDGFLAVLGAEAGSDALERWWPAAEHEYQSKFKSLRITLVERVVEPGQAVCVLGQYQFGSSGRPQGIQAAKLLRGDPDQVVHNLRRGARGRLAGGLVGLGLIHAVLVAAVIFYPRMPEAMATRNSSLIDAAKRGDMQAVRDLLDRGADPDSRDNYNSTPLYWTVHPEIARLLISRGANVDAVCTHQQRTALHEAAERLRVETAKVLVDAKANLNAQDKYGRTPLMEAARAGKLEMVRLLIEAGAALDLRDSSNQTALTMADGHYQEVASYLRQAGAFDDVVTAESGVPLPADGGPILVACRSYFRAHHDMDLEALKPVVSPEIYQASEHAREDTWKEVLEITPRDVMTISGYVNGNSATVIVSGPTSTGAVATWELQLSSDDGQWRIVRGRLK